MTRHFTVADRRRRLLARHHLAAAGPDVDTVAGDVVGLHSSDPASVYLSLWARLPGFTIADLDDALYQRRALLRVLGMRRTMFVVPRDLAAVIDASCTQGLVAHERRRTIQMLAASGIADAEQLVARACAETLDALRNSAEPMPARALTPLIPALQTRIMLNRGKNYEATPAISNRILLQLAIEGHIVRAAPLGTWLSSQYRWATTDRWIGGPLPPIEPAAARAELVRRWLRAYGPGTTADLVWWTKWTKRDVTAALADLTAVEVTVEPSTGADSVQAKGLGGAQQAKGLGGAQQAWVLGDDLDGDHPPADAPVVSLLPSLDPAIMGWKHRDWYLGDHAPALFDRNGNAGPVILVDGAVVGGWAQDANGRVVTELLQPVDPDTRARIDAAAEALTDWFGGVRVTPRFPTPLQTRLADGGRPAARSQPGDAVARFPAGDDATHGTWPPT